MLGRRNSRKSNLSRKSHARPSVRVVEDISIREKPSSGYLVNFNSLYNKMGEDIDQCRMALIGSSRSISANMVGCNSALSKGDRDEAILCLQNLLSDFVLIGCDDCIQICRDLKYLLRSHHDEMEIEMRFNALSSVVDQLLDETDSILRSRGVRAA